MSKKVLLTEWARLHYDPPPPVSTLRRWAREGEFWPPVEKAGKHYYVADNAKRISAPAGMSLVERITA